MVYCARERSGAFGETIAKFRPDLGALAALASITDDSPMPPGPLAGTVPAAWWQVRAVGQLLVDPALRFVDVTHPDTLVEIRAVFASLVVRLGESDVDLSIITSQHRLFTQRVARYIYAQRTDSDTPAFAGIRYLSRHHAGWECWAIFSDRLRGRRLIAQEVTPDDPGLVVAAGHFGLTVRSN